MGTDQSKPKRKLDEIDREVTSIRSTLRESNRSYSKEMRNNMQETLIKYSNQASELKGKVGNKKLDITQKNISQTMREVLTLDSDLDKGAVETDSIVQVPQTKKTSSLDRSKRNSKLTSQSRSMPSLTNTPNLQDIENKLKTLRSQIKLSLQSDDTTQLRVYKETLKVLATSLELIDVPEYTPIGDKKKKLETTLTSQYQTIVKALKDIKRNRDIKYLSNLKQRENTVKELEKIREDIDKYDSLTREAFKAGDTAPIKEVQQNLKEIRQRLNSVNSVDENSKTLKLQMEGKISWLGKLITQSALKGSQPDLTKAQSEYEEIIKNIASGKSKSEMDLKEKLKLLQNFTSSIDSLDEENVKKKTQLLNNINESLTTLQGDRRPRNQPKSVHEIISKNESFQGYMLDNFVESWQLLKNGLRNSNFPLEVSHQIDNTLYDVQTSIEKTRETLRDRYQKNNTSQDPADDRLISNYVNTAGSETENQENQVNVENLRSPRQEQTRFSRIKEIQTQVYYLKEKFETSIQKPNIKTKLEDYIKTLEEYIRSDNEVIANNAKILLADINDMIRNIDNAMSSNDEKLSIDYYNEIINRIDENVAKLEKSAKNFQADRNETGYQDTKKLLNEVKEYLDTLDIPNEYESANSHKLKVTQKIEQIIENCERESFKREEAYTKEVRNTLESLKDRINRFAGPYKGVLYNALEKDLNKILIDADANISNKYVLDDIIKDSERFLKILEQRALKDQSFRELKKTEDNEKMSALKEDLQAIKNDIDATPMNAITTFIGLNSRLDLIKLSLDQLKNLDENSEHQKEIICNEIETQKNVVEAKIALGQQDINQTSLEEFKKRATEENNRRITEELDKIEFTFEKLKEDITNFIGTKSDKKYYELDESTMRLIVKMDDLKLAKGTQLYDRKVSLLKEIHQYEDLLESRTRETEDILQFERDVNDIETNFPKYAKSVKDLEKLNQRINNLKNDLEHTRCNLSLQNKKKCCIEKMNDLETRVKMKINENILFEENLLQIKYSLEVVKKNISNNEISSSDVSTKLSSIKTELLDMRDLNTVNLEQRTNILVELEALERSIEQKEVKSSAPTITASSESTRKIKNNFEKELLEIERNIKTLKTEIHLFTGTSKDGRFCELNEGINKLIMKLDDMKFDTSSTYQEKKVALLRELNYSSELLDKRVEDTENILQFEDIITDIEKDPSKYSASDINDTINRLQKIVIDSQLNDKKSLCLQKLRALLNKHKEDGAMSDLPLLVKKLTELENKVENFSGTSSDNIFKELRGNLDKLFSEVQEKISSKSDNQKENDLLEQIKISKIHLVKKAEENEIYSKFITQLDEIKNQINATKSREVMSKMHNKLKCLQTDVERTPLKEKLKNDIHRKCTSLLQLYSDKINTLPVTSYIGSADFIKDLERSGGAISKPNGTNLTQDYEDLTKRLAEMEIKVRDFFGGENSDEYKSLEDELLKMNVKIKKLVKDSNDTETHKKRKELKEKVVNCLTTLDEKVQDFEKIEEVEGELENVEKKFQTNMTPKEHDVTDEKLISLQLRLGKLKNLNVSSTERKNKILQKIAGLMKKVKQLGLHSSEDSGTSI